MARVNNLTNFLNDVATAIKTKLGDNTSIPAAEFDSKIMEIETAGTYQNKSISITTNGNYELLPDTGFDAMDQVSISVNVPVNGVQVFETEQAMRSAGLSVGDKAIVYNNTDKLIGYYDTASMETTKILPITSIQTYDDTNNKYTVDLTQRIKSIPTNQLLTFFNTICTEYGWESNWGTWIQHIKQALLYRNNGKYYVGSNTTDKVQYTNGSLGNNSFVTNSYSNSTTTFFFEYCEVDLDNFTYGNKQTITCEYIEAQSSTGSIYHYPIGPTTDIIPIIYSSQSASGKPWGSPLYNNIIDTSTKVKSYNLGPDNTVINGTETIQNLLDKGFIYGTIDGNITSYDILRDKIAYSQGQKIVGQFDGIRVFDTKDVMENTTDVMENNIVLVYNKQSKNFDGIYKCLYSIDEHDYFYPVPVKDLSVENNSVIWNNNIDQDSVYLTDIFTQAKTAILEKASEFTTAGELTHLSVLSDGSIATLYWENNYGNKRFDAEVCYYRPEDKWYLCSIETTAEGYSNPKIIKYNIDTGVVTYSDITVTIVTSGNSKIYISPNEVKTNMVYLGTGSSSFPIYNSDGTTFYSTQVLSIIPSYHLWKNIYTPEFVNNS